MYTKIPCRKFSPCILSQISKRESWSVCDYRQLFLWLDWFSATRTYFGEKKHCFFLGLCPGKRGILQTGMHFSEECLLFLIAFKNGRKYKQSFHIWYVQIGFQIYFGSGPSMNEWVHSFLETHASSWASAHSKFKRDQTFFFVRLVLMLKKTEGCSAHCLST